MSPFDQQNASPDERDFTKQDHDLSSLDLTPLDTPAKAAMRLNFRAGKITPEQAREAFDLKRKTGLPQSAVLDNMQHVQDMLEANSFDDFGDVAPYAAEWMGQDVIRTNIARDDLEVLKGLEGVLQRKSVGRAWGSGRESGQLTMELYDLLQQRRRDGSSPELEQRIANVKQARAAAGSYKTDGFWQFAAQATAEQLPIFAYTMSERFKGMLYGGSLGALAGSPAGGIGAIPGAAIGSMVFGSGFSSMAVYRLESTLAEEEYRDDGLSPEVAAAASSVYGVMASIIEMPETITGMKILFGSASEVAAKPAKETVKMTVKGAIADFAKNSLKLQTLEAFEEGAQELTQWAVGEVAKYATGVESHKGFEEALQQSADAALKALVVPFSTVSTGPRFALDVRSAYKDGGAGYVRDMTLAAGQEREQEILASIDDLSATSKLAQRDPLLYEEAVRAMNQGGPVQNVYIPAGGLVGAFGGMEAVTAPGSEQAVHLQNVLDTLGVSSDDMALAVAGGSDLVIPLEKYAAAVAQNCEFATLIANDRRLTPDGFTVREMDQWVRENRDALREAMDSFQAEGVHATQLETETQEIHWAVQQQLEAVGESRDVARANAAQVAAFFGTVAQRAGMTPMQLWSLYAPDVAQEGGLLVEAEEVLPVGEMALAEEGAGTRGDAEPVTAPAIPQAYASQEESAAKASHTEAEGQDAPPALVRRGARHEGVTTLDDVYAKAGESREGFQSTLTNIAQATGGRVLFRPGDGLKSRERAQTKIDRDYGGEDATRVLDVLGGTVLYGSSTDVRNALAEVKRQITESGGEIVREKDRFTSPAGGYKDVMLNVRLPNGLVTEVLITTEAMAEAKNGLGHTLYEAMQLVAEGIDSGSHNAEMSEALRDIGIELDAASQNFYNSTGSESNSIASPSVIVYPLYKTSAILPLLSSSSLYPKLEVLLGNILYSLKSSDNTKAMSSYSLNLLTKIGSLGVPFSHGMPEASLPSKNNTLEDISEPPVAENIITQDTPAGNVPAPVRGESLSISLADGTDIPGRYEVRDAAAVIPSHDPLHNFQKRDDYPPNTQERPYHSSADEQHKVRNNAAQLDTRYVISDNPDAVNGPPIVTEEGIVLGGNSRAMSIQLAYAEHPELAKHYREVLKARAAAFGLDPAAVDAMRAPMLVRVAEGTLGAEQRTRLVRVMNQSRTQGLDANAEAVSRGRLVSENSLKVLAHAMQEHDTLAQYLASSKSRALVDALESDGVIEATQRSRMTNKETGLLNEEGKRFVQLVLRGRAIPDFDVVDAAPASVLQVIDRILPHVASMQALGEVWDLTPSLMSAVRQIIKWKASGHKRIDTYFNQGNMVADAERDNPAVQALARQLAEAKPTQFTAAFARYVDLARQGGSGMAALPGMKLPTPETAFQKAFGGRELFQPLNAGVDLNAPVQVVDVTPRFAGQNARVVRKRFPTDIREAVLTTFGAGIVNVDSGMRIGMSGKDFLEHLKFADGKYELEHLEAIAVLPELMRTAKLIESYKDKKPSSQSKIKQMHRFMSALSIGGENYAVIMTVKEFEDGSAALDMKNPVKLYHHRVEKKLSSSDASAALTMPTTTSPGRDVEQSPLEPSADISNSNLSSSIEDVKDSRIAVETEMPAGNSTDQSPQPSVGITTYTLRSLLEDVKDSAGNLFLSLGNRGSFTMETPSGRPLITLFQQADASTFLHESGHAYLEMLRSLGTAKNAPADIVALWQQARDTLNRVTGQTVATDEGIATPGHELWASSLENYFMQGQAPSMELRGVFAKFSAWLRAIYNAWRSMGVQPAEALYPVFDRLFATDEQMAEVQAWHEAQKPWAQTIAENEAQARSLEARRAKAQEEASTRRLAALTRAYIQALGGRKRFSDEARATVNAMPVYAALDAAAGGVGMDYATVVTLVGADKAKELVKKRPGLLRHEGGEDPAVLAAGHGYDSTGAMLAEMLSAEKKSSVISRLAGEQEQALRDKVAQGVAETEAMPGDVEYHSDAQLAVLLAERQLLAQRQRLEQGREKQKDATLEAKALREAARQAIAGRPVSQAMQAHKHSLGERRAARQAWKAAKAGRWEKAAEHKRQEAVSHAMYLAALEAREIVEKALSRATAIQRDKKLSADARDCIEEIGQRFGIFRHGAGSVSDSYTAWREAAARDQRDFPSLREWEEQVSQLGYPVFIEEHVFDTPPTEYRELSLERFMDVAGAMEQIRTVDRLEHTAMLNGKRVELAELAGALETAAAAHRDPVRRKKYEAQRIREGLGGIHAAHAKMEAILLRMDGWKHGLWWETFFKPIADAEDARSDMLRDAVGAMRALVTGIMDGPKKRFDFFNERTFIERLGEGLTMNQIVSVALNMGNADNRARLMAGEEWTQAQLNEVLSHLEKHHWDFVQGVWDLLETFKPASFALQRELTGKSPKAVEAMPVETPFGTYRGGYYPIAYSPKHGDKALARAQKAVDQELFGGRNYGTAMTRHGHLKQRGVRGTGERLNLDVGVMAEHIYNTAHDVTHRKAVIEVAKCMRHAGIMDVIKNYSGPELAREFMPWLKDIANESNAQENMTCVHKWARWARRGSTMMAMGLKISTMLQQPLGISQTMNVIGIGRTANGIWKVYRNPTQLHAVHQEVMEKSAFMRNRLMNFDRDVRDMTRRITVTNALSAAAESFAYQGIAYMQLGVDLPTWVGAHEQALSQGKDDAAVVAYADSIVRLTQSSGMQKDLARVQRGGDLKRLFTSYYSFFNALYQLTWRIVDKTRSVKDLPRLAAQSLLLYVLPAILSELVSGRGPDDDEEWAPWMVKNVAVYPFQSMVGVREVASAIESGFDYQMSGAASTPKSFVTWAWALGKAWEEDDPSMLIKPTIEALGFSLGLPLRQPIITLGNIYDFATGETPDFQLRDLAYPRQRSRR